MKFFPSKGFGFKAAAKPLRENCLVLGFWTVQYLDNFQVNLIWKNNCIMMLYEKISNNIMASYMFMRKP
jgi:hypothetical protein